MPTEMQNNSEKTSKAEPATELDSQSLAAIRNLLDTQPESAPHPVSARQARNAARAEATAKERKAPASQPETVPDALPAPTGKAKRQKKPARNRAVGTGIFARLRATVTEYRPTAKHILLASLALLVLFRPLLVIGLLLLNLFLFVGVFLVLGYDGFWKRAMGMARWYAQRRPSRAADMHRKLDTFALKWDGFLDRFPEGTVDGLYLPDFGGLATADARHGAAMDRRFAIIREGEG